MLTLKKINDEAYIDVLDISSIQKICTDSINLIYFYKITLKNGYELLIEDNYKTKEFLDELISDNIWNGKYWDIDEKLGHLKAESEEELNSLTYGLTREKLLEDYEKCLAKLKITEKALDKANGVNTKEERKEYLLKESEKQ